VTRLELIAGLKSGRDVFWSALKYVVIGAIAFWAGADLPVRGEALLDCGPSA
jgi:hypothetical protein